MIALYIARQGERGRLAVDGAGGFFIDPCKAERLSDGYVKRRSARLDFIAYFRFVGENDRRKGNAVLCIFDTEHFKEGQRKPTRRTGEHRTDVFSRPAVVVLCAVARISFENERVFKRLV